VSGPGHADKLALFGLALCLAFPTAPAPPRHAPPGLVVEEVTPGGTAARAGLRPGDVLRTWTAVDAPKIEGRVVNGPLDSPFDLAEVEATQAPLQAVELAGLRDRRPLAATLAPGEWRLRVRPVLEGALLRAYEDARERLSRKDLAGGIALFREAAGQTRSRDQSSLAAWFLAQAAEALAAAERWPEALEAWAEAKAETSTDAQRASIAKAEGLALGPRHLASAEGALREALGIWRRLPGLELAVAADLNALGALALERGELAEAEALHREALALAVSVVPENLVCAESMAQLAFIGTPSSTKVAETLGERAFVIRQRLAPESQGMAQSLTNVAGFAYRRGDIVGARDLWMHALDLQRRLEPGGAREAWMLNNLGVAAADQGDIDAAEQFMRRSLALMEKLNARGMGVVTLLNNLCMVALERGDFPSAEALCQRSLVFAEAINPDSVDVATTLESLATVIKEAGDRRRAERTSQRALALLERLVPDSIELAEAFTQRARLLSELGEAVQAEALAARALALLDHLSPNGPKTALTQQLLGDLAQGRGDGARANLLFTSALTIRARLAPGTRYEAESLHSLGKLRRAEGRLDEAAELSGRAVDALDRQRSRLGGSHEARTRSSALALATYRDYVDLLLEKGLAEEAFHTLERSRARAFLAVLAERDLVLLDGLPPEQERERRRLEAEYDQLQETIAEPGAGRDPAALEAALARLGEARDRRDALVELVRIESPRLAALRYPVPLDLAATRAVLEPGTVLLAYAVGLERTLLFVVESRARPGPGLSVYTIPKGEAPLRLAVESFRRQIERGPAGDRSRLDREAAELQALLVGPAAPQLVTAARILISPDGPLHLLPFAALQREGAPLVLWKPIHMTPSATVYAEMLKTRHREDRVWKVDLLAFGDPLYSPSSRPLPATRREVAAIAAFFPGRSRVLVGDEATEERAKALGKDARYLHFACHGLLNRRFPLDSALALTPPGYSREGVDNGLLQAWEVMEQMRLNADLVTLSACESGVGAEMSGEGLLGLTRAFLYAGARSVLASLWDVSDRATAELMERFYRRLPRGEAKDEALRSAQVEMLRASRRSHPFYWAGFQLVGDRK